MAVERHFRDILLPLLTLLTISCIVSSQFWDLQGDYCRVRRPRDCCPGRDDTCSMPILGTSCYCDIFCNRTSGSDCCPDFWEHCIGIIRPQPIIRPHCSKDGHIYNVGESFKKNCNTCTCRQKNPTTFEVDCEERVCLIRPELIDAVNKVDHGWRASNYSFLWSKTLEDGIRYRLGTFRPSRPTMEMTEIHTVPVERLPTNFDARRKWATLLQPIRDQGDCGASWAFSTTALASDRLAVMSGGLERAELSPQLLISCQSRGQRGCSGGHLDRAWWFLRKHGTTSERCYPYQSGATSDAGRCEVSRIRSRSRKEPKIRCPQGGQDLLYQSTPPYRVANREDIIMQEIYNNGPVQATFRVQEDFYIYRSGVYQHTRLSDHLPETHRQQGWHSVRILGWGEDSSRGRAVKYWLCANSWGSEWGEDGYFRIIRGENECDIESFVVGVWAKQDDVDPANIIGRRREE